MTMTWTRFAVWLRRIGIAALAVMAVIGWSLALQSRSEVDDLVTTQRRQQPNADYVAAENKHQDCRKNHEDQFLGAVGEVLAPGLTTEQRAAASDKAHAYGLDLERIEDLCPTPTPPVFNQDGKLVTPFQVSTTTTTTTTPGG